MPSSIVIMETRVQAPGWEDSLEKETAIHSSTIAWTEEPGRLQCMGSQKSDTTERLQFSSVQFVFSLRLYILPSPNKTETVMDTMGEGKNRMNGVSNSNMYILP